MGILTEYFQAAMSEAQFELMENGRYFGTIPSARGCWADGATVEKTRAELASVFESWVLFGLQFGNPMPVIGTVDINQNKDPITLKAV
jgi:predicted RNase H-like HicB family nuclease